MSILGPSIATPVRASAADRRAGAFVSARRVLQGLGGVWLVAFAAAMPWVEFASTGVTLGRVAVPTVLLGLAGLMVLAGGLFLVISVGGLLKRLPVRTTAGVAVVAAVTLLSLAGVEYGYLRAGGVSAYEYRPAVRLVLYALGITLLACSVPEGLGHRAAAALRERTVGRRAAWLLALGVVVVGGAVGGVVLDGMPHITDGTAYLLEARTLWSGRLSLDAPLHPALFERELLAFRISEAGYFGKYPAGWPIVLGGFDALGVPWLANAVLAGLLVGLTYGVVLERGSRRLAGLSASGVALCPWLWFNAGTMMSHLASAVWLWVFLWLLLRALRTRGRGAALLAGLALGGAVMTRPADAAFFALPAALGSLGLMGKQPRLWLTRLPLVAVGVLPGVAGYLWINHQLTGGGSTYGGGHASAALNQTPDSFAHALAWLQESWVGVSSLWFAGAVPAAGLVVCGAVFGRRAWRGHGMMLACCASLFVCYGVFVFGGRAWVGPRWYVPLIPAGAMLIAAGLDAAAHAARHRSPGGVLAAGYLRAGVVAGVVVLAVAVPVRLVELSQSPPHGIDGRVVRTVERAGLNNAVVALPPSGLDPATGRPNYKRGIAGMWAMDVPFEQGPVVYVAAIDGWQQMAGEAWPDRTLYEMNATTGDYTLTRVDRAAHQTGARP